MKNISRKRSQNLPRAKTPVVASPAKPEKQTESRLAFAGAVVGVAVGLSTLVNTAYDKFFGEPRRSIEQKMQLDAWLETVGVKDGSPGYLARQAQSAEIASESVAKLAAADEKDSMKQAALNELRVAFHYLRLKHANHDVRRLLQDAHDRIEALGRFPNAEASKVIAIIQENYPGVIANLHEAISPKLSKESGFLLAEDFGSLMVSHECYIDWTSPIAHLTKQVFHSCSQSQSEEYSNLEKELIQLCNGKNEIAEKILTESKYRERLPKTIKHFVTKADGGVDIGELDVGIFLTLAAQDIAKWKAERGIVLQY